MGGPVGLHGTSLKQAVTSLSVGVGAVLVVPRSALYSRKREPLNWAMEAPLVVKNVAAVPSGPTKLNGPFTLFEPATWNFTEVLAGVVAVQESVVQVGELPTDGLPSLIDEAGV